MKYFFDDWDRIQKNIDGKYLLLLLDYDGTLTPIVKYPSKAVLGQSVRKLLKRLSVFPQCSIAIISGRELNDLRSKVKLKNIIYSGNHGFQIHGPKLKFIKKIDRAYRERLKQIKSDLQRAIKGIHGAFLEDKGFTLALHYRNVATNLIPILHRIFLELTFALDFEKKIKLCAGKKVYEVYSPIDWDKGAAVQWLLAKQRSVVKPREVVVFYIGDDTTDEDVFKALDKKGITIVVGENKKSLAKYFVESTVDVKDILMSLEQVLQRKRHV